MAIITLTTDWGDGNHYAGAVKGSLLRMIPGATIVDISHHIPPFDIMHAAFVLQHAWPHFPEGTIHLLGVNAEAGLQTPHLAVKHRNHWFVGADNGVFSLVFEDRPSMIIELELMQDSDYFTFSTRDVFAKAAALIAKGASPDDLGKSGGGLNRRIPFSPVVYPDRIIGKVIFVDGYQNAIVNINKELFRLHGKNRRFRLIFRSSGEPIRTISQAYSDVVPGEKLALFGSTGLLEIAINQGKASGLLGLHLNDTVTIEFNPEADS